MSAMVAQPVVMGGSGQKLMEKNSGQADLVIIEARMVVPSIKIGHKIHVSILPVLGLEMIIYQNG